MWLLMKVSYGKDSKIKGIKPSLFISKLLVPLLAVTFLLTSWVLDKENALRKLEDYKEQNIEIVNFLLKKLTNYLIINSIWGK